MSLTEAQRELVERNVRLAQYLTHRLYNPAYGIEFEDVLAEAYLGLCRAAATYDPARGHAFSVYASVCIYSAIFKLYRDKRCDKRQGFTVPLEVVLDDDDKPLMRRALLDEKSDPAYYELDRLVLHQYLAAIRALAHELGPDIEHIVELRLRGLTQEQIATQLHTSQPSISRRLRKLKKAIQQRGGLAGLAQHVRQCHAGTARSE